jgi:hypothetical protein
MAARYDDDEVTGAARWGGDDGVGEGEGGGGLPYRR